MLRIHKNKIIPPHYFMRLILLFVVPFFCLQVSGQSRGVSKEEYAIFSSILNDASKDRILNRKREFPGDGRGMHTFVILNKTSCPIKPSDWEPVDCTNTNKWTNLKPLFDAMLANNQRSYFLRDHFSLTSRHDLISETKLAKIFQSPWLIIAYEDFHKKYPVGSAIYRISRAGFNARRTKALVYVFVECSVICAFGRYIQLNKVRGKWKVMTEIGC